MLVLERSELPGCWQIHRYYIYNKYSVDKLATLSLYRKSFISNNNIVTKLQYIYWLTYEIIIDNKDNR